MPGGICNVEHCIELLLCINCHCSLQKCTRSRILNTGLDEIGYVVSEPDEHNAKCNIQKALPFVEGSSLKSFVSRFRDTHKCINSFRYFVCFIRQTCVSVCVIRKESKPQNKPQPLRTKTKPTRRKCFIIFVR